VTEEFSDKHVRRMQYRRLLELVRDPAQVPVEKWTIPEDTHLLRTPAQFRSQIVGELTDPECKGEKMPAAKTHGLLQFREHEVTVWFGFKNSYKSVFINELFTYWACRGISVALASFEMPAFKLAALAVRQSLAVQTMTEGEIDRAIERLSESMVIYDVMGRVSPKHMLAVLRYCAIELGCRHFLIDNLTTLLPVGNDHSDLHQQFASGLLAIARETGVHVHVVAHCAKPLNGDMSKIPNGYSIRGTGSVPDMVENLVGVWRNLPKEDKLDDPQLGHEKREEWLKQPDLVLIVDKQKFWDYRGALNFWISRPLLRFREGGYIECEPFL
jgi:twinkle protein